MNYNTAKHSCFEYTLILPKKIIVIMEVIFPTDQNSQNCMAKKEALVKDGTASKKYLFHPT